MCLVLSYASRLTFFFFQKIKFFKMHVRITFQLTTTGGNGLNEFGISGSIKELGEWNTDLAVKLTRESTTLCTATVEIDSQNEEFEYKYIQFGLENEWEKGINRKRQVPSDILQVSIQ